MGLLQDAANIWSGSSSTDPSGIWSAQEPYLTDIYQRAQATSFDTSGQQFAQQFQQPTLDAFNQQALGGAQQDLSGLQNLAQTGGNFQQFQNQQDVNLQGAIQSGLGQITNNFNRNILPGINTGAAMTGTSGGSRQGIAQGLAASDANQQASDFVQQMMSGNFQQTQDRSLQAQQAGVNTQLGAYGQLGQFGQQTNQAQQSALGAAPSVSNLGFQSQFGNLNQLSGLVGSPTVLGGGGTNNAGVGDLVGEIGGAFTAFSDERVKENIKEVGKLDNGLPVYSFNYIWDKTPIIGLMAQDVEKVIPEAVTEIGGIKAVYYDLAVGAV